MVHSSTFGRNNLAMAAGLASLQVIEEENLVERARQTGAQLRRRLEGLKERHSLIKEVRGIGLMIAIEFHEPTELAMRMGWKLLHKVERELFAQMIVTSLFKKHRILTQIAGHAMDVLKILPPLIIGEKEIDRFVNALDSVLNDCRNFPGPIWDLARTSSSTPFRNRRANQRRRLSSDRSARERARQDLHSVPSANAPLDPASHRL